MSARRWALVSQIALAACMELISWVPLGQWNRQPCCPMASQRLRAGNGRAFAEETQVLPRWGNHLPPDAMHRVLQMLPVASIVTGWRASDPIKMLKTDHQKVLGMLKKLETAAEKDDGKARGLMEQIDCELKIHTQIEEEIFHPAFKEAARNRKERELFFEEVSAATN